jgi:hypothetical protein
MFRKFTLPLSLTCLFLMGAAADMTDFKKGDVPADFKEYKAEGGKWSIKHPDAWKAVAQKDEVTLSPRELAPDNINIRFVGGVPANLLKLVAAESIKQVEKSLPGVKIQNNEPAKFGDLDAYYLVCSGEVNGTAVKVGQLLVAEENTLYVITTSTVTGNWEKTWPLARQMIASFVPKAEK